MKSIPFLKTLIVAALLLNQAGAQDATGEAPANVSGLAQKLAQKIRMVNHILNSPDLLRRVKTSGDPVAAELLERAASNFLDGEEYYDRGQFLEADAVLDYVLRDLSAGAQLMNQLQQKKAKYLKFRDQLNSFVLPEWENLGDAQTDYLQARLESVSELSRQAAIEADAGNYDAAADLLEQAYAVKAELLQSLKHEQTIVYDLDFDSVQDEYQYLASRVYHYLELVHLAMTGNEIDSGRQQLIDGYIYRSMVDLEAAEAQQTDGDFSAANRLLQQSIDQLQSVLKILGIRI